MSEVQITIEGMDELAADLEKLVSRYPDKAGELLQKNAKKLRKQYIQNMKSAVRRAHGTNKSLVKAKNVKIYPIHGFGKNQQVDIGATSPHFHLFERGHNLIIPWLGVTGFVEGRFVMKKTLDEYEHQIPAIAQQMCDELLKEGNLL